MTTYLVSYWYRTGDPVTTSFDSEEVTLYFNTEVMSQGAIAQKLEDTLEDMYPMFKKVTVINFWKM